MRNTLARRALMSGVAAAALLGRKALAGGPVVAPYVFAGSQDDLNAQLKARYIAAQQTNPLVYGYSAATNWTATWTSGGGSLTQQYTYASTPAAFQFCGGVPANSSNSFAFAASYFPAGGQLSGIFPYTSFTGSISGSNLTASSGTGLAVGQLITDPLGLLTIPTTITGGSGTAWTVSPSQTVASTTMYTSVSPFARYGVSTGRVRFMTSASTFEIHLARADGNNNFHVLINGKYVTPSGGLNPNSSGCITVTNSNGGHLAPPVLVEVSGCSTWTFRGVYVTNVLDTVWAPATAASDFQVIIDGDSFSQSNSGLPTPVDPDALWYQQLAFWMGWTNVCSVAISSTGYISNGNPPSGTPPLANTGLIPLIGRLNATTANTGWMNLKPQVLVVAAGYNDDTWGAFQYGVITTAQIAAACVTYCQTVRAKFPGPLLIFVLGPWSGGRGPDPTTTALDAAMGAAVTGMGDARTFYIAQNPAPNNSSAGWVTGTGSIGSTNGSGNSDWVTGQGQKPHPAVAGNALLGRLAAAQIGAAIMNL